MKNANIFSPQDPLTSMIIAGFNGLFTSEIFMLGMEWQITRGQLACQILYLPWKTLHRFTSAFGADVRKGEIYHREVGHVSYNIYIYIYISRAQSIEHML